MPRINFRTLAIILITLFTLTIGVAGANTITITGSTTYTSTSPGVVVNVNQEVEGDIIDVSQTVDGSSSSSVVTTGGTTVTVGGDTVTVNQEQEQEQEQSQECGCGPCPEPEEPCQECEECEECEEICTEITVQNPQPGDIWAYKVNPEEEGAVTIWGSLGTVVFYGNTGEILGGTFDEENLAIFRSLLPENEEISQIRISCTPMYVQDTPPELEPCYLTTSRYIGGDPRASYSDVTIVLADMKELYDGTDPEQKEIGYEVVIGVRESGYFEVNANIQLLNGAEPGYVKRYEIPVSGLIADVIAVDGRDGVPVDSVRMGDLLGMDPKYDHFMNVAQAELDAIMANPELVPLYIIHVEDSALAEHADFRVYNNGNSVDVPDRFFVVYGYEVECPDSQE